MNIYQIKDWNERYENNRSRTVKDLSWVPIPNRHDGEAYSRLMLQKDAPIIFTVWILLLQVASRCHPRGSLLTSSGQPHNSESLSIKTRAKVEWFEKSLPFLVQIGWVSVSCQEGDSVLTVSCQLGDEERREGMEEKSPTLKLNDEEWFEALKTKFPSLDMESERRKAEAWLLLNPKRQFTRRFFTNWVTRAETPIQLKPLEKKFVL